MTDLSFIPTRGSACQKQCGGDDFVSTSFETYKPKGKKRLAAVETGDEPIPKHKELDLKSLRFEVLQLGVSGFNSKKKEECNIARAIRLGARPPKNKHQNYKEFKELRLKAAKEEAEEKRLVAIGKIKGVSSDMSIPVQKLYSEKKEVRKPRGILRPYGVPGKVVFKKHKKKK